jgi:exodeoxyribonuclease III
MPLHSTRLERPVVLAGDYNVVPTDLDIYSTKSWDRNALLQPKSRAAYQRLLAQGSTDAIPALHPKEPMYTFWDTGTTIATMRSPSRRVAATSAQGRFLTPSSAPRR